MVLQKQTGVTIPLVPPTGTYLLYRYDRFKAVLVSYLKKKEVLVSYLAFRMLILFTKKYP